MRTSLLSRAALHCTGSFMLMFALSLSAADVLDDNDSPFSSVANSNEANDEGQKLFLGSSSSREDNDLWSIDQHDGIHVQTEADDFADDLNNDIHGINEDDVQAHEAATKFSESIKESRLIKEYIYLIKLVRLLEKYFESQNNKLGTSSSSTGALFNQDRPKSAVEDKAGQNLSNSENDSRDKNSKGLLANILGRLDQLRKESTVIRGALSNHDDFQYLRDLRQEGRLANRYDVTHEENVANCMNCGRTLIKFNTPSADTDKEDYGISLKASPMNPEEIGVESDNKADSFARREIEKDNMKKQSSLRTAKRFRFQYFIKDYEQALTREIKQLCQEVLETRQTLQTMHETLGQMGNQKHLSMLKKAQLVHDNTVRDYKFGNTKRADNFRRIETSLSPRSPPEKRFWVLWPRGYKFGKRNGISFN